MFGLNFTQKLAGAVLKSRTLNTIPPFYSVNFLVVAGGGGGSFFGAGGGAGGFRFNTALAVNFTSTVTVTV